LVSNLFENDTFVELAFSLEDTLQYIYSASEYFSIFDGVNIDSISIYFGNVNFSATDSIIVRIVNTTSLKHPTSLLKKFSFAGNTILPNAWNTFPLDAKYKTSKHFCIDYILPVVKGSSDSAHFVFVKNATYRNSSLSTAFLKENTTWIKVNEIIGDNCYYSSPIRIFLCPSDLSIPQQPTQEEAIINVYPNPANEMLNIEMEGITSLVELKIYNISGQLLYIRPQVNPMEIQSISIIDLPVGMYFLKINSSKLSKVKSFIVE